MALFDDNFLTILRTAMQKRCKRGVKSQVEDAKGDVAQQLQQVQNFIGQGVDAIIVNPVDTNAVKPIIDQATKAGIPLVFVNRRPQITLTDKMAYVGSDSVLAGRLQMEALAKAMNGKGNVAILLGDRRTSQPAIAPKAWKKSSRNTRISRSSRSRRRNSCVTMPWMW